MYSHIGVVVLTFENVDSDYTILTWRQKQASSDSDTVGMALFLHNPSLPLPQPPAYTNPSYYLFKRVASMSPKARSVSTNGARSIHSRKSRKSVRSVGSGMLDDGGVPKYKKDFFKTHNQNGVRTVIGTIGPVKGSKCHVLVSLSIKGSQGCCSANASQERLPTRLHLQILCTEVRLHPL